MHTTFKVSKNVTCLFKEAQEERKKEAAKKKTIEIVNLESDSSSSQCEDSTDESRKTRKDSGFISVGPDGEKQERKALKSLSNDSSLQRSSTPVPRSSTPVQRSSTPVPRKKHAQAEIHSDKIPRPTVQSSYVEQNSSSRERPSKRRKICNDVDTRYLDTRNTSTSNLRDRQPYTNNESYHKSNHSSWSGKVGHNKDRFFRRPLEERGRHRSPFPRSPLRRRRSVSPVHPTRRRPCPRFRCPRGKVCDDQYVRKRNPMSRRYSPGSVNDDKVSTFSSFNISNSYAMNARMDKKVWEDSVSLYLTKIGRNQAVNLDSVQAGHLADPIPVQKQGQGSKEDSSQSIPAIIGGISLISPSSNTYNSAFASTEQSSNKFKELTKGESRFCSNISKSDSANRDNNSVRRHIPINAEPFQRLLASGEPSLIWSTTNQKNSEQSSRSYLAYCSSTANDSTSRMIAPSVSDNTKSENNVVKKIPTDLHRTSSLFSDYCVGNSLKYGPTTSRGAVVTFPKILSTGVSPTSTQLSTNATTRLSAIAAGHTHLATSSSNSTNSLKQLSSGHLPVSCGRQLASAAPSERQVSNTTITSTQNILPISVGSREISFSNLTTTDGFASGHLKPSNSTKTSSACRLVSSTGVKPIAASKLPISMTLNKSTPGKELPLPPPVTASRENHTAAGSTGRKGESAALSVKEKRRQELAQRGIWKYVADKLLDEPVFLARMKKNSAADITDLKV